MRTGVALGTIGLILRAVIFYNLVIFIIIGSLLAGLTVVTTWAYMIMFINYCGSLTNCILETVVETD